MTGSRDTCIYDYINLIVLTGTILASAQASSANGWTRVIVEKPFGRDSESSAELTRCLKQYLAEDQIFRYTLQHSFFIR